MCGRSGGKNGRDEAGGESGRGDHGKRHQPGVLDPEGCLPSVEDGIEINAGPKCGVRHRRQGEHHPVAGSATPWPDEEESSARVVSSYASPRYHRHRQCFGAEKDACKGCCYGPAKDLRP